MSWKVVAAYVVGVLLIIYGVIGTLGGAAIAVLLVVVGAAIVVRVRARQRASRGA